jgi:hypothetical protein
LCLLQAGDEGQRLLEVGTEARHLWPSAAASWLSFLSLVACLQAPDSQPVPVAGIESCLMPFPCL